MPDRSDRRDFLRLGLVAAGAAGVARLPAARADTAAPVLTGSPPHGVAKLNANENPVGPSAKARRAIADAAGYGAYYVGDNVKRLKAMIAEHHGLSTAHVALSSGSSGVLTSLAVAASRHGEILGPDLFWDTTVLAAGRQGAVLRRLPKVPDLGIDLNALYDHIDERTALVHVTNPNNPTGLLLDAAALRAFCVKASEKAIVLVDEAYNELTDDPETNSMADLVRAGHKVAVARTFSKIYGLAGLRVGYMVGHPEIIAMVDAFSLGDYALNQAGVAAALASYNDLEFMARSKAAIVEAREMAEAAIRDNGLRSLPSQTNFLFVDLGTLDAEAFRSEMAARGVLIRGIYRDYTQWSRVSMGRLPDVGKYAATLPQVLDALNA